MRSLIICLFLLLSSAAYALHLRSELNSDPAASGPAEVLDDEAQEAEMEKKLDLVNQKRTAYTEANNKLKEAVDAHHSQLSVGLQNSKKTPHSTHTRTAIGASLHKNEQAKIALDAVKVAHSELVQAKLDANMIIGNNTGPNNGCNTKELVYDKKILAAKTKAAKLKMSAKRTKGMALSAAEELKAMMLAAETAAASVSEQTSNLAKDGRLGRARNATIKAQEANEEARNLKEVSLNLEDQVEDAMETVRRLEREKNTVMASCGKKEKFLEKVEAEIQKKDDEKEEAQEEEDEKEEEEDNAPEEDDDDNKEDKDDEDSSEEEDKDNNEQEKNDVHQEDDDDDKEDEEKTIEDNVQDEVKGGDEKDNTTAESNAKRDAEMTKVEHDHELSEKDLKIEKMKNTIARLNLELGKGGSAGGDVEEDATGSGSPAPANLTEPGRDVSGTPTSGDEQGEVPPCPPGATCETGEDKKMVGGKSEGQILTKRVVDGDGEKRMVVVETGNAELAEGLKGGAPDYRIPESGKCLNISSNYFSVHFYSCYIQFLPFFLIQIVYM